MSFYELEPWGAEVEGIRHAVSAASSANAGLMVAAPKQLKRRPYKPKDFFVGVTSSKSRSNKGTLEEKFHRLGKALTGDKNDSRKPNSPI